MRALTSTYCEWRQGTPLVLIRRQGEIGLNIHMDLGETFVLSTGNTKEKSDPTMLNLILYETLNKQPDLDLPQK